MNSVNVFYQYSKTEYEKKLHILKAIITNSPVADLINQLGILSVKSKEYETKYNTYTAIANPHYADYTKNLERDYYAINEMIRRIKEEIIRRCGE